MIHSVVNQIGVVRFMQEIEVKEGIGGPVD